MVLCSLICLVYSQIPSDLAIIDGHNDLPHLLYKRVQNDLNKYSFLQNLTLDPTWGLQNCSECHSDLPRMREGKIGAQVS